MWQTLYPPHFNAMYSNEPRELRLLKNRLAHVNCNCNICQPILPPPSDLFFEDIKYTKDIETQSEGCTSVDAKAFSVDNTINNALCPTCCMTLNLLRGGVVKVLKDEESETQTSMFSTDEFSERRILSKERDTVESVNVISPFSSLTLCDFPTETSSDGTVRNTNRKKENKRKRCTERVTFLDPCSEYPAKPRVPHDCVCLQDFVDAIRPPF